MAYMRASFLCAAMWLSSMYSAGAVMGSETIMSRVDTDKDKQLSWSEVRIAAGNRYDLIQSKNGGRVSMLQLGGRIVPSDLKQVGKQSPSVESPVSKEEYLALAKFFFDKADVKHQQSDAPGSGTLDIGELSSADGKKLIGLLQ